MKKMLRKIRIAVLSLVLIGLCVGLGVYTTSENKKPSDELESPELLVCTAEKEYPRFSLYLRFRELCPY